MSAEVSQRLGEKPKRRLLILVDLGRRDELVLDLIETHASPHGPDDQPVKP